MPKYSSMAKRSRSAPRKTSGRGYKPRRSYGRPAYNPVATRQAGSLVTRKIRSFFSLVTNSPTMPNELKFTVAWMQPGNQDSLSTGNMVAGFDQNFDAWDAIRKDFQQYAVTGCKLEYIPGQYEQPGEAAGTNMLINGIFLANTLSGSTAGGVNLNSVNINRLKDFRDFEIYPYSKHFSKYINLKPLAKDQNLQWQNTTAYS